VGEHRARRHRLAAARGPRPARNYFALSATDKRLCWLDRDNQLPAKRALECVDIANKGEEPRSS